jgi:hypothetical protein
MTLSSELTGLADEVRGISGRKDKLTISDMTNEINTLEKSDNILSYQLPTFVDSDIDSVASGNAQRFSNRWSGEYIRPKIGILLDVNSGDEVVQSILVKTDGYLHDLTYNFSQVNVKNYPVSSYIIGLGDGLYRATARTTIEFTGKLTLLSWWANLEETNGSFTYVEISNPYVYHKPIA